MLSGSMLGWGDDVVAECDAVVFLTLDPDERLRRLDARRHRVHTPGELAVDPGVAVEQPPPVGGGC